jgi:chorismate lyase / 3-hydroxybenzoate synthase
MAAIRPLPLGPMARLGIAYRAETVAVALARADTLAAISFGLGVAAGDEPRHIDVPLQPIAGQSALIEVWQVESEVARGRDGEVAWAEGGGYLLLHLRLDESESGGLTAASARAYRRLRELAVRRGHSHLLRAWNYLADINQGTGDDERYRHFSIGRAEGIAELPAAAYPAATAIGRLDGRRELLVYLLAATQAGTPIENPRQVSAYRYPREYGPVPPSFARAMRLATAAPTLLISGTASVVGHASRHDDAARQAAETLCNLDSLVQAAGLGPQLAASGACLKAYVRHRGDASHLRAALAGAGLPPDRVLLLHGDICRAELLLEIDGSFNAAK